VEDDPFYHRKGGAFEGVEFESVLGLMPGVSGLDRGAYKLRFICSDGYQTTFTFGSAEGARGVLSDGLVEGGDFEEFPEKGRGKGTQSAGPYYLVWEGEKYDAKRPWPYQLVRIEVVSVAGYARGVTPPSDAGVEEGYEHFRRHCLPCHSVNLNGGRMGPELNVPQNILEYRGAHQLKAFILDPSSFRSGSPMPATGLSPDEVDKVLDYLRVMKGHKECATAEACASFLKKMQDDDL